MGRPRNVLLITIDQWRADALGCAGNAAIRTPHLDALAADGTRFARHFASASPCAPSRAALLTGMYQHNNGVMRNGTPLDARFTNVALEARKAGYDPALFGYTDTAADPRGLHDGDPALQTFESVLPGFAPELHLPVLPYPWLAHLARKGYGFGTDVKAAYSPAGRAAGQGPTRAPARFRAEDSITAFLTDELLDYIGIRKDKPWFVHAAHIRPHPPFIAPEPYDAMYRAEDMPLPRRAATPGQEARQHPFTRYAIEHQTLDKFFVGGQGACSELSDADLAQLRATYYGMVSEVDDQIGRLVAHLRQLGLYEHTLIIVTSDHGEMLGDHWMFGKDSYFAESFHVPLIVCDPDASASSRGTTVSRFTEAVDLMPTVLQWLGLPLPRQCDGYSLLPFCHGEPPTTWRQDVHFEYDFRDTWYSQPEASLGVAMDACGLAVVRDEHYQYVHFAALPPLFFDLSSDPHCLHNRVDDPALAPQVLAYAQRLLTWRMLNTARELTGVVVGPSGTSARDRNGVPVPPPTRGPGR
jgi:arylsulfatase A-like enzyme